MHSVIPVNVPMDKIGRSVPIHQIHKALEASVGQSFEVIDMESRSVGKQDVKPVMLLHLKIQPPDSPLHLLFRVHIRTGTVSIGTTQPKDPQPLTDNNAVLGANTAIRRHCGKAVIMISQNIYQRAMSQCDHKFQIALFQIPAG